MMRSAMLLLNDHRQPGLNSLSAMQNGFYPVSYSVRKFGAGIEFKLQPPESAVDSCWSSVRSTSTPGS